MKITTIRTTAGRTFNHPTERYANFRFDIELTAELSMDEDPDEAKRRLMESAETTAEQHKADILAECRLHNKRELLQAEIRRLSGWLEDAEDVELKANEAAAALKKLSDPTADIDEIGEKWGVYGRREGIERHLNGIISRCNENAANIRRTNPDLLRKAQEQLAALPAPRLLTVTIHPGHPDHAETTTNEYDDNE